MEQKNAEQNLYGHFVARWRLLVEEIKENPMAADELNKIYLRYLDDLETTHTLAKQLRIVDSLGHREFNDISETINMLTVYSAISLAKWKNQHPGFFSNFQGLRIEKLNLAILNK